MLSSDYIIGFVDGEGSFTIGIGISIARAKHQNFLRYREQIFLVFAITQGSPREWILEEIKRFFGCGIVVPAKGALGKDGVRREPYSQYHVYRIDDIITKIIPFFDEHPPILKLEEYKKWREAAEMIRRKEHLTGEGIEKLKQMKAELH
jgi:hypothetical protein